MTIFGTAGNDDLDGTGGADKFDLSQGGNDTARGLAGKDVFLFGGTFTDNDRVEGGGAQDTLKLQGDYSGGLRLGAEHLDSIEQVSLLAGEFVYDLVFKNSAVAAGNTMTVNATAVFGVGHLLLDASAELDAAFVVKGSSGNDVIATGSQSDTIAGNVGADIISPGGGQDTVNGGEGNDTVVFGTGELDPLDRITDVQELGVANAVVLDGNYGGGLVFEAETMTNISFLTLTAGHDYTLDMGAAEFGDDISLVLDGLSLEENDKVQLDARGMDHYGGSFVQLGAANDVLVGGKANDFLIGGGGADTTEGDRGIDAYGYNSVADSIGTAFDTVIGFNAHQDRIFPFFTVVSGEVTDLNEKVSDGTLSEASFDADLAAAIGADELGADCAVLFKPDAGDFAGKLFLLIDGNAFEGYQAGEDLVVRLSGATNMNDFSIDNFG
jgi:Ca2+-binding RTX toxin-like protein